MEHSKELIGELLAKLAQLNSKVDHFRQDMLFEFNKFTEDLLDGVPANVSFEVTRVIAESMAKYPSLSILSWHEPDSPVAPTTTESRPLREARKSPPPILYHTSGIPKMFRGAARDPHAREFEFQGLFTPSYLPLLDGNDPPAKQHKVDPSLAFRRSTPLIPGGGPYPGGEPPYDSPTVAQPEPAADTEDNNRSNNDNDEGPTVEMIEEVGVADTDKGKSKEAVRPSLERAPTDVSISSSVGSSTSDHKIRRSALRRSSSSTKGSPRSRRVRFDVEGTEVLPTSSPQPTESFLGSIGESDLGPAASSAIDDSEDYFGPSLSDVEGEEDHCPRPPRISSTDALRRLSRTPSDDGTVWISSNESPPTRPDDEGSSEVGSSARGSLIETATSDPILTPALGHVSAPPEDRARRAAPPNGKRPTQAFGSPSEADAEQDDEDDNEEEVFLAIRSPKKAPWYSPTSPSAVSSSPTLKPPASGDRSSQRREESPKSTLTAKDEPKGTSSGRVQHADEEVFNFEDAITDPGTAEKYLPEHDDEDTVTEDTPGNEESPSLTPGNLYSTSPAVSITKRKSPSPPPTTNRPVAGSIGSYKGKPLRMSAVLSPKIAEEAAGMGDVKTYVGSIHGRTGIDPADESSYRASFSNAKLLSGTPRSFSERMMMEEAMGKQEDDDDVD